MSIFHPNWIENYHRVQCAENYKAFRVLHESAGWMYLDFLNWLKAKLPRCAPADIWLSGGIGSGHRVRQYLRTFMYDAYPDFLDRHHYYMTALVDMVDLIDAESTFIVNAIVVTAEWRKPLKSTQGHIGRAYEELNNFFKGVIPPDIHKYYTSEAGFWFDREGYEHDKAAFEFLCPVTEAEKEAIELERKRLSARNSLIAKLVSWGMIKEIQAPYLSDNDLKLLRLQYTQSNKERVIKRKAARAERVAKRVAAGKAKRQDILEMIPGSHTNEEWLAVVSWYGGKCLKCGKDGKMSKDHVIPVTWEGANDDYSNLQPLCCSCNSAKGNYSDADYRPSPPPPRDQLVSWYREQYVELDKSA